MARETRQRTYRTLASVGKTPDQPAVIEAHGDADGYRLNSRWALVGGRAEPVEITLTRGEDVPVTASSVRSLPLGDMLEEARHTVPQLAEIVGTTAERTTNRPFKSADVRGLWRSPR